MASSLWIDVVAAAEARTYLSTCCGSTRWVDQMIARRPFGTADRLQATAREVWFALHEEDWLEAFSHHPKIGDRTELHLRFPRTAQWSATEQQGVDHAASATLEALAELNQRYEEKFGFIFIVCATGKSADEMLALLRERITNDVPAELCIAAEEQAKITELRLQRAPEPRRLS